MEFLNDYLVAVVVGICLCIGYVLKHAIPSDKINRFIPLLMLVLGAIVNVWLHDFTLSPEILLGMHQAYKQMIEGGANADHS